MVRFKAPSIQMVTSYVTIGHGRLLHSILRNVATDFENKTTEIDFAALVRKFLDRK